MQEDKKGLEPHENIIEDLLALNLKLTETRLNETEAIETIVLNIFIRIAYYLKAKEAEANKTGAEELEAYESVMQNLLTLKEKIIDARLSEAKAIRAVLHTLSDIHDSECDPAVLSSAHIPPTEDTESILSTERGNIVIYAN